MSMKATRDGASWYDSDGVELTPRPRGGRRVLSDTVGPSLTVQADRDRCDVNQIIKRHRDAGTLSELVTATREYADFSDPVDFQSAMNIVNQSSASFMKLPAEVRARFQNSPGKFLEFVSDPANLDEMIRLGLAVKRPDPPPSDADRIVEAINKQGAGAPAPASTTKA